MKKLTKVLSVLVILSLLVVSLAIFVSCKAPETPAAEEDSTFTLVIRKATGAYEYSATNPSPSMEGDIILEKTITIKEGQSKIVEAFEEIDVDTAEDTIKILLNSTDYLIFTYDTTYQSWALTNGYLSAQPAYTEADYFNSYMARNGEMSSGISLDAIAGLETYTIVIDGWNGVIGS